MKPENDDPIITLLTEQVVAGTIGVGYVHEKIIKSITENKLVPIEKIVMQLLLAESEAERDDFTEQFVFRLARFSTISTSDARYEKSAEVACEKLCDNLMYALGENLKTLKKQTRDNPSLILARVEEHVSQLNKIPDQPSLDIWLLYLASAYGRRYDQEQLKAPPVLTQAEDEIIQERETIINDHIKKLVTLASI